MKDDPRQGVRTADDVVPEFTDPDFPDWLFDQVSKSGLVNTKAKRPRSRSRLTSNRKQNRKRKPAPLPSMPLTFGDFLKDPFAFRPGMDRVQLAVTHEGKGHTPVVLPGLLAVLGLDEEGLRCTTPPFVDGPAKFVKKDPVPVLNGDTSLVVYSESHDLTRAYYHELAVSTNFMLQTRARLAQSGLCRPASEWDRRHGHDNYLPVDSRMQMDPVFCDGVAEQKYDLLVTILEKAEKMYIRTLRSLPRNKVTECELLDAAEACVITRITQVELALDIPVPADFDALWLLPAVKCVLDDVQMTSRSGDPPFTGLTGLVRRTGKGWRCWMKLYLKGRGDRRVLRAELVVCGDDISGGLKDRPGVPAAMLEGIAKRKAIMKSRGTPVRRMGSRLRSTFFMRTADINLREVLRTLERKTCEIVAEILQRYVDGTTPPALLDVGQLPFKPKSNKAKTYERLLAMLARGPVSTSDLKKNKALDRMMRKLHVAGVVTKRARGTWILHQRRQVPPPATETSA